MSLDRRYYIGDLDLTDHPFASMFGFDPGDPAWVVNVIDSMLQDGDVEATTRAGNRVMVLPVLVEESDLLALAQAEALLHAECSKPRNEFRIDPGDGYAPVTVFDTFQIKARFIYDDDSEWEGFRRYDLTIPALPFPRSLTEVVETAHAATGGADTQIDACDSATNWTAAGGTLSVDTTYKAEGTGALKIAPGSSTIEPVNGGSSYRLSTDVTFTRSALSLNLSTTPFIAAKVWTRYSEQVAVTCLVDGVAAPLVASRASSASNGPWTTFYFYSADASVSSLAFRVVSTSTFPASGPNSVIAPSSPDWAPRLDDVRRSGESPTSPASGKERTLRIPVRGSARTQGSLSVGHASTGLGKVLVYTNPLLSAVGYTPDLTRWTVSYLAQASSSAYLSGFTTTLDTTTPWRIEAPAAAYPRFDASGQPVGYELMGFMTCGTGQVVTVTVSTIINGNAVAAQTFTSRPLPNTVDDWVSLGWLTLDPAVPPGSTAQIRLDVKKVSASSVTVQELFLFATGDDSALTVVDCGSAALGASYNRLWIKAPTLTQPLPQVMVGSKADETDSFHMPDAAITHLGSHSFVPSEVLAFIATAGVANPEVSYRHPKRWHSHAAEE